MEPWGRFARNGKFVEEVRQIGKTARHGFMAHRVSEPQRGEEPEQKHGALQSIKAENDE
jgi:hypothetical protein